MEIYEETERKYKDDDGIYEEDRKKREMCVWERLQNIAGVQYRKYEKTIEMKYGTVKDKKNVARNTRK